jgi:MFS family permease
LATAPSEDLRAAPKPAGRVARIRAHRRQLPENVRVLGWVSLANDMASELAYPIVPLFLTITLGAPVFVVGVIEAIAESVAVGVRYVSGRLSDLRGQRRRPWIVTGYSMSTVARGVIAAAPAWGWVLAGRVFDRFGKGTRSTARDALIKDSTPAELQGSAFGYHRAMDTTGAFLGPSIAVVLLAAGVGLRTILWVAFVPGLLTLLLLRRLREASHHERAEAEPATPVAVRELPRAFWVALAIWMLFSIGNSSDVFLILRAHDLGLSTLLVVLAYVVYNAVYAVLAWPFGALSDRIPRRFVLAGGVTVFALVYLGFALANASWAVWPLFAVYGVYIAATDGVARAWIGDVVPRGSSGTAYGVFSLATAGALFIASVAAGALWSYVDPRAPFILGAVAAALTAIVLLKAPARPAV